MLHWLASVFVGTFDWLRLLDYLTVRTGGALMTSFVLSLAIGPGVIRWLKSRQGAGQPIRDDGPETHFKKAGTPTMGGLMILFSGIGSTLLWMDFRNAYAWIVLFVTLGFGMVGMVDDYLKLTKRNPKGLSGKKKLVVQYAIATVACFAYVSANGTEAATGISIPFIKDFLVNYGIWLFLPFTLLVLVGASNAVNLTDGLDGLAIVPVIIAAGVFGVIAYLTGNKIYADYLLIQHVPNAGELAIFCGALIGAGLGFLWFNAPPAMVFMGDTGSLAMGGALGATATVIKHELVLAIVGGVFVLETVSVILQVASFKLTGKRIFRMAPLHHHFEKKGWAEPTVVIRFWIIAFVLGLLGLATLKIR